jgi:hypothetical protein
MSDVVDEHLDKAFASLDDIPSRELHATADALERRRDGLRKYASIFRNVADARGQSWGTDIPRFHLRENVSRADEQFAERIADASAPFWCHVREAVQARPADD